MSHISSSKAMNFSTKHTHRPQTECDTIVMATKHASSSRSTPSISSSSSFSSCSSSNLLDDSSCSPPTPLRFSGVPFSWEYVPGIPKKSSHKKKDPGMLMKILPLPPPALIPVSKRLNLEETGVRKKNRHESSESCRDPFLAALVECSKDDNYMDESTRNLWNIAKVTRSISDRFGFINLYASCKRNSDVSDSVYLPSPKITSYDLSTRHSR